MKASINCSRIRFGHPLNIPMVMLTNVRIVMNFRIVMVGLTPRKSILAKVGSKIGRKLGSQRVKPINRTDVGFARTEEKAIWLSKYIRLGVRGSKIFMPVII